MMKLFSAKPSDSAPPSSRRRPGAGRQKPMGPAAFSYYSQRSSTSTPAAGRSYAASTETATRDGGNIRSAVSTGSRAGIYLAAVILLAGGIYMLGLSGQPKIIARTSGGSAYFMQETGVYQRTAAKTLGSSWLSKSKLTVDTTQVSKNITDNYPEVARAIVQLPLIGSQPVVYIEPHRPSFILTTIDNAAYLLDENGRALVSVNQISDPGKLSVPTLQDKSGLRVVLGAQAVPGGLVSFTEDLLAVLKSADVKYAGIVLPPASSELQVQIAGKPYFVKFNLRGDARQQGGTYLAAKQRLEKDRVTPSQYIDVRIPERAYYK